MNKDRQAFVTKDPARTRILFRILKKYVEKELEDEPSLFAFVEQLKSQVTTDFIIFLKKDKDWKLLLEDMLLLGLKDSPNNNNVYNRKKVKILNTDRIRFMKEDEKDRKKAKILSELLHRFTEISKSLD